MTRQRLSLLSILVLPGAAFPASLAPTDPSINASLGLWLTDAASNFDGVTWADSSGNGNDATTVGLVNINAPVTFAAPTLDLITPTIDQNSSSLAFAGNTNDLMRSTAIFGGSGTNQLTIFSVHSISSFNGGNSSLTRPVGFGSVAANQAAGADYFNLASDPSVRKDNGQIGANNYSGNIPLGTSFIRVARMDANGIDEWFNTSTNLNPVLSDFGTPFTTSTDDFFLGDLRAGPTPVPGVNGAGTTTSDLAISQVIVYNSALTDVQIEGINEFLLTPVPEPGSLSLLGIAGLALLRRRSR
jgi:hypothetical protein